MAFSGGFNLSMRQHNPLFSRGAGRVVIQIPFDDSIDASNALECFFQMPTQVAAIRSAKVWVQRKSFRTYNSAASATANTTHTHDVTMPYNSTTTTDTDNTGEAAHTHGNSGNTGNQSATHTHDASSAETQNHLHAYSTATAAGASHSHPHSHGPSSEQFIIGTSGSSVVTSSGGTSHAHTITLTSGIFETAASGTVSLAVASDGINYGAAVTSGVNSIDGLEIKEHLRGAAGDRRIKITATGLMRVQVLLVLDLKVAVLA